MKRKAKQYVLIFGAIVVAILMVSSATAVNVLKTNELTKNSLEGELQPDSNLQFEQEIYNYMSTTKIGEVKQSIYESYKEEPMEDDDHILDGVDAFFEILPEIGVTDDMTILEADSIIEENWDIIEASVEGVNRFCKVRISAAGYSNSWCTPPLRFGLALRCKWQIDNRIGCGAEIDGTEGLQKSEDKDQSGRFLLLSGHSQSFPGFGNVRIGGFAWISISDVPFENSGNGNQQSNPSSNPQSSSSPNLESSATALPVTQTSETKNIPADELSETYVDPDIYLTTADLSVLYESLQYIDNSDVLQLVQGIIDLMEDEDKGYVTAEDIQNIENDLGIFLPVHAGLVNSHGGGMVYCLPGGLLFNCPVLLVWPFPAVVVHWQGDASYYEVETSINGGIFPWQTYEGNHDGFIIGFLGVCVCSPGMQGRLTYRATGIGTLIIVIPGDGCNMQSNPQSQPSSQSNTLLNQQSSPSNQQSTTVTSMPSSSPTSS